MPNPPLPALHPPPRDVLVLRALPGLGDLLCVTPALRALRAALPGARTTVLGLPATRPLVARYPHLVDEFREFPGFPGLPESPANVAALPEFLRSVQGRFDLVVQMHGSGEVSNTFAQLLGGRALAGLYRPPLACPDPATFAPYPEGLPEPLVWLALLAFLGIPGRGESLEFPLAPGDEADCDAVLRTAGVATDARLALVHVGASEAARRLEPRLLARVADDLAGRGLDVALTGAADESAIAAAVRAHAGAALHDLTGRTALGALGALVRRARLVVTGDTGVSHLASALRTPSVVVFLASDVRRWAPLDRARHRVVDATASPPTPAAILAAILAEVDALLGAAGPGAAAISAAVRAARRVLVVPPAGATDDLAPALRRLRSALPGARLVLLAGSPAERLPPFAADVDEVLTDPARAGTGPALASIERLAAARLDAAIVFTAAGESPFEAAYLAYLAGIPLRAGISAEFGGGVLSPWVRPPPRDTPGAGRHLFLLGELGLGPA